MPFLPPNQQHQSTEGTTVQENTDKQTQYKSEKVDNLKYSKNETNLAQLPLTTFGQETRWAYSAPPRAHTGRLAASAVVQLSGVTSCRLQRGRVPLCDDVLLHPRDEQLRWRAQLRHRRGRKLPRSAAAAFTCVNLLPSSFSQSLP